MPTRAALHAVVVAFLAIACSEDQLLPPLDEEPPPFAFSQYLQGGEGELIPHADVLLVRRPKHLEHVYALALDKKKQGHAQAKKLFDKIEGQFKGAGIFVAEQAFSLRCAAVELPDCIPRWGFIEELLGPGDGPGSRRLRQALASSFEARARQLKMENTLVLATVNVLLTRGLLKSAVGNAAAAEARAAVLAEQRTVLGPAPGSPAPSPGLVQVLTGSNPTPPMAPGPRLPQDVAVSPKVPKDRATTRPISSSPSQNAQIQADIRYLRNLGATNIRVNQQQIAVRNSQRVGINRPDLQFDYNGRRYYVEYDTPTSGRSSGHQSRLTSNDPNAEIILLIVP
jgi:hypothetical protein